MNLLCPNCQKMLQVPEQYAGQQMKCPLCAGAFTVPALPQMPAAATVPAGPKESAPAYVPPPPDSAASPHSGYATSPSAADDDVPHPAISNLASTTPPAGYKKIRSFTLNPNVVPLMAPLALGIVFILLFFPWVVMAPGGETAASENGWGIAFGSFDPHKAWIRAYQTTHTNFQTESLDPGVGFLQILFLLLFLFVALPLAVLCVMVARKSVVLPPAVAPLIPWRSALLALVILGTLLLVLFQVVLGFNLENKTRKVAESYVADERNRPNILDDEKRILDFRAGQYFSEFGLAYTFWFKLVVIFLLIALAGAGLDYWLEKRGTQPLPRIDFLS